MALFVENLRRFKSETISSTAWTSRRVLMRTARVKLAARTADSPSP